MIGASDILYDTYESFVNCHARAIILVVTQRLGTKIMVMKEETTGIV